MNYKNFTLGDWIGHISGVIEDESELDGNEMRDLVEFLSGLPKWIPCGERQPKENGNYLALYRTSDGTTSLEFMMVDHCNAGGGWLHEGNGRKAYKKVIAWMPLPEPYKAEMESEE